MDKITTNYQVVSGAYGRDYKSGKAAKEDFLAGKDFLMQPQGCYCSITDFAPGVTVNIRYKAFTEVIPVKVPA